MNEIVCEVVIDITTGLSADVITQYKRGQVKVKQSRYRPGVAQRVPGS